MDNKWCRWCHISHCMTSQKQWYGWGDYWACWTFRDDRGLYSHLYNAVKYHRNQIGSQVYLLNAQTMDLVREKKSAFNALIVYVVFLSCHLPNILCIILSTRSSETSFFARQTHFILVGFFSILPSTLWFIVGDIEKSVCLWKTQQRKYFASLSVQFDIRNAFSTSFCEPKYKISQLLVYLLL